MGKTGGKKEENTDESSGHYVVASSRPPERRPLERRTLVPIEWKYNISSPIIFKILFQLQVLYLWEIIAITGILKHLHS